MKLQNLTAWRYLITLASFGRVSDVATHFDVNSSSVSRALRDLESALGRPLFRMEGRNLRLTQEGRSAVRLMKPAVDLFDQQLALTTKLNRNTGGRIRLSVAGGFAAEFLLDYLERFKTLHPDIIFDVSSGQKISALRTGSCDVVTVTGKPKDNDLVCLLRGINHYIPVATPAFLEKHGAIDSLEKLPNVRVFAYGGSERDPTKFMIKGKEKQALEFGEYLRIDSISAIKHAVMQDKGVAIDLPHLHCANEISKGTLVPILSGWHRPQEELYVVTSKIGWKAPRIRLFAQWFADESQKEYAQKWQSITDENVTSRSLSTMRKLV